MNKRENRNTLELRSPNATVEEVIWQNNINAFTKMLTSSKDCAIDERFLDFKIKGFEPKKSRMYYDEVQLRKALEFVDMIFDNNLDKMYFLRQYIKGFEESIPVDDEAVFAKSFIK